RLAEQERERVVRPLRRQRDGGAEVVPQTALDQRLGEPALRQVMRRADQSTLASLTHQRSEPLLRLEIHPRWRATEVAVRHPSPLRTGQLLPGLTEQEDDVAGLGE